MNEITSTPGLLEAEFDRIELAQVRLKKGDPAEYVAGRVVDRWRNQDLTLRFRGHTHEVPNAREWELVEFSPVQSSMEKQLIRNDLQ